MRKTIATMLCVAAAAIAAVPAHAEGRLDKIKASGEISLGYRESSIPFSYLDDQQKPIGYSLDICHKIVDALEQRLDLKTIKIKLVPITGSTRIPLMANGTVDLNCGSSTNTKERQAQVTFAPTTFVTATRFVSKKSNHYKTLDDLKGKTVVSTAGTSNMRWLVGANKTQNLGMNIIPAKEHTEAMLTVEQGRAAAFFMDDILLAGLVATSQNPSEWVIGKDVYTVEPYAIMEPKNDPEFKAVVDGVITGMMKDGDLQKLYTKWFESPIPPKNVNMNWPMSEQLKRVVEHPTDSPDPALYR